MDHRTSKTFNARYSTRRLNPIPIHLQTTTPRLQLLSPFYSGILPAEIRTLIFSYALTPTPVPDTNYDPNTHYTRPGFTCRTKLHVALLRTCRRIYLETYHLPPTSIPHVFWHERYPPGNKPSRAEHPYFLRLPDFQLALVNSIHLHTQLFWLEDSLTTLTPKPFLQNITTLKITIRRGDWWWNEQNEPLAINPYRGNAHVHQMHLDMEASRRGDVPTWALGKWGCAFAKTAKLEVLELEFETSEEKREELQSIVEWARTWEFPMGERGVLSTRKNTNARAGENLKRAELGDVKMWEWRGQRCHWSDICPYCVNDTCSLTEPAEGKNGDKCRERKDLLRRGEGPMLVVMEVKWKLRGHPKREDVGVIEAEGDWGFEDQD
ncbi:hypothetical protein DSL72_003059 [Monilinia vaccinii-corymbosi]|uniref:Uncharacterized protein n=1 Tax=Monilinia vaccinii-corymbosi TaxID=61207 RepID=A0A8A3P187_9HELO|nr:hypothetical protein DSL72_003059 [Monilinia vaccinii-corymbosi]